MATKKKTVLSWSGGKDSAMALHELQRSGKWEVVSLLTTVAKEFERISHHGVRTELLERQAEALGVPLHIIYLPAMTTTNAEYEAIMEKAMLDYKRSGVETVAFGDIFLEDLPTIAYATWPRSKWAQPFRSGAAIRPNWCARSAP